MSDPVLTPAAQADIEEIWDYTDGRWGSAQAERYIRLIQVAIETVARDPRRGRPCDGVRKGYRKYSVGKHLIFFQLQGDRVEVVRVLHQSMDFEQHL